MQIVSIDNVGSPVDDPNLKLPGLLYKPTNYNGRAVVSTCAGGFKSNNNLLAADPVMKDLCNAGFLCLSHWVRLTQPIPGQTTSGRWHQQTDDLKIGTRALRQNHYGFGIPLDIGGVGGSGSAGHVTYNAIDGAQGDDKLDWAIAMSPPTDYSDRQADTTPEFRQDCIVYGDASDLDTLRARSPIALPLNVANPILHFQGYREMMPLSQGTLFSTAMADADVDNYTYIFNSGQVGRMHGFQMWPSIKNLAMAWIPII